MEARYLVAGVNILAAAGVTAAYALAAGSPGLLGAALAAMTVGVVVAAYGLAGGEPAAGFLVDYSESITGALVKVLEDMDLLTVKPVVYNRVGSLTLVYSRNAPLNSGDPPPPGIGVWRGSPYVALSLDPLAESLGELVGGGDPGTAAEALSARLGVADSVHVENAGNGRVVVAMERVNPLVREALGSPVNPVALAVLASVSAATGRDARLESLECTMASCRAVVEVATG